MVVAYPVSYVTPAAVFVPKHWAERRRAAIGLAILAPFAVAAIFSRPWLDPTSLGALGCSTLGWLLFLAGGVFRLWATLHIGGRKGRIVVDDGPYSLTRNPLYFGIFLMTLSIAAFLQSLALAIGLVLAAYSYLQVTVQSEERRLSAKLGQEFRDYCGRISRFWPRPATFQTPAVLPVDVRCLWAEGRRALRWMWIPLAAEAVMRLRVEAGWPELSWFS
jgi:protein-S-isoprenylcysteine O-methyltransferase Ste14